MSESLRRETRLTCPGSIRAARLTAHGAPLRIEEVALRDPGPRRGGRRTRRSGRESRRPLRGPGAGRRRRAAAADARQSRVPAGSTARPSRSPAAAGSASTTDGTWAQAVVVERAKLTALDPGVDLHAAAGLGIVGVTAYNTVVEVGQVDRTRSGARARRRRRGRALDRVTRAVRPGPAYSGRPAAKARPARCVPSVRKRSSPMPPRWPPEPATSSRRSSSIRSAPASRRPRFRSSRPGAVTSSVRDERRVHRRRSRCSRSTGARSASSATAGSD